MKPLRVYVHYRIKDGPWGGGNQFLKALVRYLTGTGKAAFATGINDRYDILLANSGYRGPGDYLDLGELSTIKAAGYTSLLKRIFYPNPGKKIVHRIDGLRAVYINRKDAMDELQLKAVRMADHVIFQSRHCVECFRRFGFENDNYTVIYNGVNQQIFNTAGRSFWDGTRPLRVFSSSWSRNIHKGFEIIAHLSEVPGVESCFTGNWPEEVDRKNVVCRPPVEQVQLANHYRSCDVFLHAARNDPCPNVVLEAMSCGLPVIYHDSGGTPEIAGGYGIPLPSAPDLEQLTETIETMRNTYPHHVENIVKNMHSFSIERAAEEYFDVLLSVTHPQSIAPASRVSGRIEMGR